MKTDIVIIRETTAQSVIRDLVSVTCPAALIGLGVFLDSSAMQWFGFLLSALFLVGVAARILRTSVKMTPQEAADHLKESYGAEAA